MCVCMCVCVWLTCYGWYCFGLILTPTLAPLCFLLQAVHTGKCSFCVFLLSVSPYLCITSLHSFFFFFNRLSVWLWHTLTHKPLDIDCQADWVMFYIPRRGELAVRLMVWAWFPLVASWLALWATHTREAACVCVHYIMNDLHNLKSYLLISISAPTAEEKMISLSI